ncbi:MAG: FMN-binding protein [Prevotella sp.]|nr:FMN-binding protein [Prevotella sp.]
MKRNRKTIAVLIAAFVLVSAMPGDKILTKQGDTTVVNTTELGKSVKGYRGTTPLKIHIKADKIVKVEALPNKETPQYFQKIKTQMLKKWNGVSVKKIDSKKVDAVTGATISSNAVKKNVELGVKYYNEHK